MLFVIFAAFFMFVACDNNLKFTPAGGTIDSGDTSDNSDTSDTSDPTTEQPDSGDSQSDDDTDTATEDDSDTIPDDDSDTDTGTTPTENALNCGDIYKCMANCGQNGECQQACYDKGSSAGQTQITALIQCINSCSESPESVSSQCASEISNCEGLGSTPKGNQDYPAPYGHADINVNVNYILTNETQLTQDIVNISYFATGTFGTSGNLQPVAAQGAYYYAKLDSGTVQIVQTPFANNGATSLNPAVFIIISAYVSTGTITVGLTQDDAAQLFVVDRDDLNNVTCYHAFGFGTLTVDTMNPAAGADGKIVITGSQLELYSTENAPIYGGNITSQMGSAFIPCPVQ